MIVVGEILHLQGSFQGALGLDNCVLYRRNRPRLYLTEEHSICWKYCLVNQKLFHLIWSASVNQSVSSDPQKTQPIFEDQRKLTACRSVQKCTEEYFSKCREMYRKNYFESHLGGDRFHFQWYRRRLNYQFSNYVTDKVNGSRVQPRVIDESFNNYSTSARWIWSGRLANEARSAGMATIISYPTSASGIIVLSKTPKNSIENSSRLYL